MVDMVYSNQPGFVKIPALVMGPERILELVLDIEQPDADRGGDKRDRQLNKQDWTKADQPDHGRDQNCNCNIRGLGWYAPLQAIGEC